MEELLFAKLDLRGVKEHREHEMFREIDSYDGDRLLNTSPEDLAEYFSDRFNILPIHLLEEQVHADQEETQIDVSGAPGRDIIGRGPVYITGTRVILYVPFEGESDLFRYQPSHFTFNPPRGDVKDNVLELSCRVTEPDASAVKRQLDSTLDSVRQYVGWIKDDIEPYNAALRDKALGKINRRREKLLQDRNLVANLGFPLRKRDDLTATYVAPGVRRKVVAKPPAASTEAYVSEPTLSPDNYKHILEIISATATMLERNPSTFAGMAEEQLRDQFLVPLNSHYEGQATGETFNASGKTDILIRVGDKTIFIAECKIWKGPESLLKAIDQLLGYTTWRDTKTAIMVFNRNKNFSEVISKIPATVKAHAQFKREQAYANETGFRLVLAHPSDPNRELILTVLCFDVPK